jgi:putative DNA primase/helicase
MAYGEAAPLYRERGWAGVLPVVGKHEHLPEGFTGYTGRWPDGDDVDGWVATRAADNVAIRVPSDVLGLDVDAYDGRRGLETLAFWEGDEQCGSLPPTWMSSARTDGSGVRLYRVPAGLPWRSDLGPGSNVEVIRFAHRYFVAWPSVHPLIGRKYEWYDPTGALRDDGPPIPQELPLLPDRWVAALQKRQQLRADGGSHRDDDVDVLDHEGERVDPRLLLLEGAPAGEQQAELFRYLCSLRARGAHEQEMITLGIAVIQQFDNARADDPWTVEHVMELVRRVRDTYGPGLAAEPLTDAQRDFVRRLGTDDAPRAEELLEHRPTENASDTGNAELFVRTFGNDLRYVPRVGWYRWDERRWVPDDDNRVLDLTGLVPDLLRGLHPEDRAWHRWATTSEAAGRREALLRLAAAHPAVVTSVDSFDRDPYVLALENGTLDLRTGELRPARREDRCSQLAAVRYDPAVPCPRWAEHVWRFSGFDLEVYRFIQRALGYSLTGSISEKAFFFLVGESQSGKNALVEPVMRLMGSYATVADKSLLAGQEQHPTILADLRGKRLVFIDELPDQRALNVERLKMLTGGTRLKARKMRQDFFEFDNHLKLWLTANEEPPVRDDSAGAWERMKPIDCNLVIPKAERDPEFSARVVAEEGPGVLGWLLEGLAAWRALGDLAAPDRVDRNAAEYRTEEQHLARWIDERLADVRATDPLAFVSNAQLVMNWRWWADEEGLSRGALERVSATTIKRRLKRLGFEDSSGYTSGKKCRGVLGIRINTSETHAEGGGASVL